MLDRRRFLSGAVAVGAWAFGGCVWGRRDSDWLQGELRLTFFNTGVGESMFFVFPDGTSVLLDCGDPSIADRIVRLNPHGRDVDYLVLSHFHSDHADGFATAAETLHFKKAIDRGWPDYREPCDLPLCQPWVRENMKALYARLAKRDGLIVEQARLGTTDQLVPRHDPKACRGFSVKTVFANGKIVRRDGTVRDLFTPEAWRCETQPENLMNIGHLVTWGKFRFFTGGDFCDIFREPGKYVCYDDMLAEELDPVEVAKVNHHGCDSLSRNLVATLRPKLWTACTWDPHHMSPPTMALLKDRTIYPGPCTVATETYGAHHVLTVVVPPGGETFHVENEELSWCAKRNLAGLVE